MYAPEGGCHIRHGGSPTSPSPQLTPVGGEKPSGMTPKSTGSLALPLRQTRTVVACSAVRSRDPGGSRSVNGDGALGPATVSPLKPSPFGRASFSRNPFQDQSRFVVGQKRENGPGFSTIFQHVQASPGLSPVSDEIPHLHTPLPPRTVPRGKFPVACCVMRSGLPHPVPFPWC